MDRHRALQLRGGGAHAHHVDDAVDGFVAVGSEDRGAEARIRFGIDDDLHESLRLALLPRAPDPLHRPRADPVRVPALASLFFADTDTDQYRKHVGTGTR